MTDLAERRAELEAALAARPIAAVLLDAGFVPTRGASAGDEAPDALVWLGEHAGQTLKILAGVDWFGQWKLVGTAVSRREAMWDERLILDGSPRGAVLEMLAKFWRGAFGEAPCPEAFRLGQVYAGWNKVRRKLNPGLPHLQVDGPMLRMIVNRLRPVQAFGGIAPEDKLWLARVGRQMMLQVGDQQWMCPAQGVWAGIAEVKVGMLLDALPDRFPGRSVHVDFDGLDLVIAGASMPARWIDPTEPSDE